MDKPGMILLIFNRLGWDEMGLQNGMGGDEKSNGTKWVGCHGIKKDNLFLATKFDIINFVMKKRIRLN